MKKKLILICSHLAFAMGGFILGIYLLPVLIAPPAPSGEKMEMAVAQAKFTGEFKRDLQGSDFLHWGEGTISIGNEFISLEGEIAPGPDYKLYLSPAFVETEEEFNQIEQDMVQVNDVKTFKNFLITVPDKIDPASFNTVVIWCESFGEFITSAQYQ